MNNNKTPRYEIDIVKLREAKLCIATPMYGGNCSAQYCQGMIALTEVFNRYQLPMFKWITFSNESLITRARNYSVEDFLKTDCTHLMFIDADIQFHPMDVLYLLAVSLVESDKNIICGPYPKKIIAMEKVKQAVDKGIGEKNVDELFDYAGDFVFSPLASEVDVEKPFEVLESGTGFMMIQRQVFETFAKAHPELLYRPDHKRNEGFDGKKMITGFFMDPLSHQKYYHLAYEEIKNCLNLNDVPEILNKYEELIQQDKRRHLSEDYYFCQECRNLGFKVWLCPWLKLNHVGTHVFTGNLVNLLKIGASHSVDPDLIKKK